MEILIFILLYFVIASIVWEYGFKKSNGIKDILPSHFRDNKKVQSYANWAVVGIFWPISMVLYLAYGVVTFILLVVSYMVSKSNKGGK